MIRLISRGLLTSVAALVSFCFVEPDRLRRWTGQEAPTSNHQVVVVGDPYAIEDDLARHAAIAILNGESPEGLSRDLTHAGMEAARVHLKQTFFKEMAEVGLPTGASSQLPMLEPQAPLQQAY